MAGENPADLMRRAWDAFQRELPQLYAERPQQWVAYQGERRIGFADKEDRLYKQCLAQGLRRDEFVVFCIVPNETETFIGPLGDE